MIKDMGEPNRGFPISRQDRTRLHGAGITGSRGFHRQAAVHAGAHKKTARRRFF
jgi:hypothetical protein